VSVLHSSCCDDPPRYACDACGRKLCARHAWNTRYRFDLCRFCYQDYTALGKPADFVAKGNKP